MLTHRTRRDVIQQLLHLNIQACLTKDISGSELIAIVKLLKNGGGQKILSPSIVNSLMHNNGNSSPAHELLTKREEQVLALMLQGRTNQAIAEALHLSRQTVRNYVHTIYQKFSVTTRAELLLLFGQRAT